MKKIKLLDCTLRDGGYINNWEFGKNHIVETICSLEKTNSDIIELGFLRDESYTEDRTVFSTIEQMSVFIPNKKQGIEYAAMVEAMKPYPFEKLPEHSDKTIDIVRVMVWKDMHDENGKIVDALNPSFEVCKKYADKGYKVFVQPVRVEQYSDLEFIKLIELFNELNPAAFYIVDSWGTMYSDDVLHYVQIADKYLKKGIAIGYHGHNNLMQAFANAVDFVSGNIDRELIVDSSVYGIGRGAGNLNSEIFARYLNERQNGKYNIQPFLSIYDNCVKEVFKVHNWGYSLGYFLTGQYHVNPQYATQYENEGVSSCVIDKVLCDMSKENKVMYSKQTAQKLYDDYSSKNK